jgi:hypothetical protein
VADSLEPLVAGDADVPLAGPPSLDDLAKFELAVRMVGAVALGRVGLDAVRRERIGRNCCFVAHTRTIESEPL